MIICVLLLCVLYYIWTLFDGRRDTDPPEMSKKLPLIGHSYLFFGGKDALWNALQIISNESLEKGGVVTCNIGFRTTYAITDPDDFLTIANTCLDKHVYYTFAKALVGESLITGNVQSWKRHRKLLNPAFHQQVLNSFMGIFNSQGRRLVDQLTCEVGKKIDQDQYFRMINLDTICMTSAVLGRGEFEKMKQEYVTLLRAFLQLITDRFLKLWTHEDFIYNLTTMKKQQDEIVKKLVALSNVVVQEKKTKLQNSSTNGKKIKPFMDLVIELANETGCFTDDEIRQETDAFIIGGHDTSAAVMTILLTVLGSNPDVQEKVFQEVLQVIGSDRDVEKEDLPKLTYTEAVFKETLRLYPIAPIIGRQIHEDVKLKNTTLRKNTCCFLFICGVNRHPMWGPDADEFRPERWLDPATLPCQKYFASFSLGKRSCIGKQYAMMSMKILLAHLVRRYRFKSDISRLKLKMDIMLRVDDGYHVTLESRNI